MVLLDRLALPVCEQSHLIWSEPRHHLVHLEERKTIIVASNNTKSIISLHDIIASSLFLS